MVQSHLTLSLIKLTCLKEKGIEIVHAMVATVDILTQGIMILIECLIQLNLQVTEGMKELMCEESIGKWRDMKLRV